MGKEKSLNTLGFVSFELKDGQFVGSLAIEAAIGNKRDPEVVLREATKIYKRSIKRMCSLIADIQNMRHSHKPIPARKIWQLGDAIFELRDDLENLSLQLDGLYSHLVRDLRVQRKWLEKVVILRRYLPKEDFIPESLNWGRCEKGTRRVAQRLRHGHS